MVDIEGHAPDPIYAGQTASASGVDLGICDWIMLTYTYTATINIDGGTIHPTYTVQKTVSLTHVDQSHVTYVFPDMSPPLTGSVAVKAQAHYSLSGVGHLTPAYTVNVQAAPDTSTTPPVTPTYGYGIPNVDYAGPGGGVVKWKLHDPYDTNTATNTIYVPINPNAMTSPWPARQINTAVTTAVDGQVIFMEGNAKPKEWSFSGDIMTPYHYDLLRSWVYERRRRVVITDHFGRDITCVLTNFDAVPKQVQRKYWRHTYTITAIVVSVGKPTKVPS